jgi:hypothetical protein
MNVGLLRHIEAQPAMLSLLKAKSKVTDEKLQKEIGLNKRCRSGGFTVYTFASQVLSQSFAQFTAFA